MRDPLNIALQPSGRLLALTCSVLLLAAGSVLVCAMAALPKAALLAAITFAAPWVIWREVLLRAPDSAATLRFREDRVEMGLRAGRCWSGRVLPSSVALPWLVVLAARDEGGRRRRYLTLFPDSVAPEQWRELQVWLRWGIPLRPARSDGAAGSPAAPYPGRGAGSRDNPG